MYTQQHHKLYKHNFNFIANEDLLKATNLLRNWYTQSRYIPPDNDWPPYHPRHYTPLTIVHHEGGCAESEILAVAEKFKSIETTEENITIANVCNKTTRSINELVGPFEGEKLYPYIILIEGAPGVGKTILSKEIAFQWAKNNILNNKTLLFLLIMRDPQLKCITDVQSLVKFFCQSDSLSNKIADWLIETDGHYLTIVLDGYDEMPEKHRNYFIVDGIIGQQKLTKCGITITSRPAAAIHLHNIVNCRVEVLGFTEED